jgi:hypothetical protein
MSKMGLAASQTRFLTLTARQHDIEYQAQQISNSRLQLSAQLEKIATDYTNSLSDRNLFTSNIPPSQYQQINSSNLASAGFQVFVVGQNVLFDDYVPAAGEIKKSLEDGIRDGTYVLLKQANPFSQSIMTNPASLTGNYESVDWRQVSEIYDDLFTANDAKAEDEYDRQIAQVQQKDKKLTLQMQRIETEHKAIESEMEAVKKVIQQSTEGAFKTFA